MGESVHSITRQGRNSYRVYSTISNTYVTPSLTERELILFLLSDALHYGSNRLVNSMYTVGRMIEKAEKLKRWENRPTEYWGWEFPRKRSKRAFMDDARRRLKMSVYEALRSELESGIRIRDDENIKYNKWILRILDEAMKE